KRVWGPSRGLGDVDKGTPLRGRDNRTRLVAAWEPGHEWRGWHEMPYGTVEDGVAVMANQRGPATPLGVEFAPPHRADRIRALLDRKRVWSAAEMPALHMDTHLSSAGPLVDRLAALDGAAHGSPATGNTAVGLSPAAAALRDRLLRWDRRMEADSVDAAAYAALRGAVVRRLAAEPAFAALAVPPAYPEVFRPWLSLTVRIGFALEHLLRSEELYGIDRDAVVRQALEEVAGGTAGRWGDSHRLVPWRALPDDGPDDGPDGGPDGGPSDGPDAPGGPGLAGDHDCVLCTSAVPGITDLSARGPAARYVWDLARREDSLWVVPFGASGVSGSAHHRDQFPLWLTGELVPVVTDWGRLIREDGDGSAPDDTRQETGQRGETR
ncbi:penicillin acylase family protein, partial [Streptomyces scabiei]|uniref:penicillin acylase family protein n=1 Tax=Streptomyces scabiei TaxID=1930 RepID=UPI0029BDF369